MRFFFFFLRFLRTQVRGESFGMDWPDPIIPLALWKKSYDQPRQFIKKQRYYKQCCDEHWGTRVSFPYGFLSVYAQQWDCWIIRQVYFQFFKESPHCSCISLVTSAEKVMAPYSSTLAWKIPWTEEPRELQSMGSQRVRHDLVTNTFL